MHSVGKWLKNNLLICTWITFGGFQSWKWQSKIVVFNSVPHQNDQNSPWLEATFWWFPYYSWLWLYWFSLNIKIVELKGIPTMNLRTVIGNMYHHSSNSSSRKESWTRRWDLLWIWKTSRRSPQNPTATWLTTPIRIFFNIKWSFLFCYHFHSFKNQPHCEHRPTCYGHTLSVDIKPGQHIQRVET